MKINCQAGISWKIHFHIRFHRNWMEDFKGCKKMSLFKLLSHFSLTSESEDLQKKKAELFEILKSQFFKLWRQLAFLHCSSWKRNLFKCSVQITAVYQETLNFLIGQLWLQTLAVYTLQLCVLLYQYTKVSKLICS